MNALSRSVIVWWQKIESNEGRAHENGIFDGSLTFDLTPSDEFLQVSTVRIRDLYLANELLSRISVCTEDCACQPFSSGTICQCSFNISKSLSSNVKKSRPFQFYQVHGNLSYWMHMIINYSLSRPKPMKIYGQYIVNLITVGLISAWWLEFSPWDPHSPGIFGYFCLPGIAGEIPWWFWRFWKIYNFSQFL